MQNEITELKAALEKLRAQHSTDLERYENQIEELRVTIEDLTTDIEKHEAAAEKAEAKAVSGLSGVASEVVLKRKVEKLQEVDELQKEEFKKKIELFLSQIAEQKADNVKLLERNEAQIKKAETFKEENIVINIEQAKHEVHERKIYVDKFIIEASNEAKVAVLERERELITQDVQREFRKRLADMEVNILAY